MIIGDNSVFAIESMISCAYERVSLRALGCFVIHISGKSYGIKMPNATMLANSYDEVINRLKNRGRHVAPFSTNEAGSIADAFRLASYSEECNKRHLLGNDRVALRQIITSNQLVWAPDGDAAFDDGSFVLQFDVNNFVRLIGYTVEPWKSGYRYNPNSLSDQWIDAQTFYAILEQWSNAFNTEWASFPKTSV